MCERLHIQSARCLWWMVKPLHHSVRSSRFVFCFWHSGRNNRSLVLAALMCSGSKVLCHASEELFLGGSSHYSTHGTVCEGFLGNQLFPFFRTVNYFLHTSSFHVEAASCFCFHLPHFFKISDWGNLISAHGRKMRTCCGSAASWNKLCPNWIGMMVLARLTWISCAAVFQYGRIFYGNFRMLYLCCCILLFESILNDQQVMLAQWICQQPDCFVLAQPLVWTWERSAEVITINPAAKPLSVRHNISHVKLRTICPMTIGKHACQWPTFSFLSCSGGMVWALNGTKRRWRKWLSHNTTGCGQDLHGQGRRLQPRPHHWRWKGVRNSPWVKSP